MSEPKLVDVTGRMRSPAATPGHWAGCAPPNKGQRYPADPPTVEEILLVMRQAGPGRYADRTRALIAILWRAGLRISEALALTETDLDQETGSVLVRVGLCRIRHSPRYAGARVMPSWLVFWVGWSCLGRFRSRLGSALIGGPDQRLSRNASRLSLAW
jgi:integrase